MNLPAWKYPISYEHMNFPDMNFRVWKRKFSINFIQFPYLEVPNLYEHLNFPDLKRQISYDLFLFGSAKFHMNFLAWTCRISFAIANFHMNFSVWKCQISNELACLEVLNFIFEIL